MNINSEYSEMMEFLKELGYSEEVIQSVLYLID
jgi:hypothetical protein